MKVLINLVEGECYSDMIVGVPWGQGSETCFKLIIMRLEINVRRINFKLYVSEEALRKRCGPDAPDDGKILLDAFSHTVAGAALSDMGAGGEPHAPEKRQSGYTFNKSVLRRTLGGRPFLWLVGSKTVSNDFLWDPAEKLYFAQDLKFTLRAFLAERPDLFLEVPPEDWTDEAVLKVGSSGLARQGAPYREAMGIPPP